MVRKGLNLEKAMEAMKVRQETVSNRITTSDEEEFWGVPAGLEDYPTALDYFLDLATAQEDLVWEESMDLLIQSEEEAAR